GGGFAHLHWKLVVSDGSKLDVSRHLAILSHWPARLCQTAAHLAGETSSPIRCCLLHLHRCTDLLRDTGLSAGRHFGDRGMVYDVAGPGGSRAFCAGSDLLVEPLREMDDSCVRLLPHAVARL